MARLAERVTDPEATIREAVQRLGIPEGLQEALENFVSEFGASPASGLFFSEVRERLDAACMDAADDPDSLAILDALKHRRRLSPPNLDSD